MEELPETEIEEATAASAGNVHDHEAVTAEDGTLAQHLHDAHQLDVPPGLSPATQQGLHDRVHGRAKAADD